MFWNQQVETLSRMEMIIEQNHKITKLMERVYEKSSLYNKRMDELGLQPRDIRTVEDLIKLPFTQKQDLATNYPYGLLVMPVSGTSYIHQTQLDGKFPLAVSYTKNDMAMWTELMARILVAGGVNVTTVFQVVVHGEEYPGCLGVFNGARMTGATLVPADGDHALRQIKLMEDFGVTAIFSTTEYMLEVARKIRQIGCDPGELPLQVMFCGMQGAGYQGLQTVEQEYKVPVLEMYGLEDIFGMGIGAECHAKDGIHIQEDCFYPEIIDPATGRVLPAGETGELVLTSLMLEAMPLLRYRTGSRGFLDYNSCTCGRTLVRFKS